MGRPSPLSLLQDHLGTCRVRVHGVTQGAGFFVAPGYVVTCAHVAGARPGTRLPVFWSDTEYEGTVLTASAPARGRELWPYPDLAVLRLPDAPSKHPCVWLDTMLPSVGTRLTAYGFSDIFEPGRASERAAALTRGGNTGPRAGSMLELVDGEVNKGLSGGPVLSHESGGVCAIVKATRLQNTSMGGVATPVSALRLLDAEVYRTLIRAHDAFHGQHDQWVRLSDRVSAYDVSGPSEGPDVVLNPMEVRQLLASFSRLPVEPMDEVPRPAHRAGAEAESVARPSGTRSHVAAFLAAAVEGTFPPAEYPLLDHRDVFTQLAALMLPEAGELPYELAFATDLARKAATAGPAYQGAVQQLRDRVLITAGRLGLGDEIQRRLADGPASEVRPSIIGRIRHSTHDRRLYHVMVWRYRSAEDVVPAVPESTALPLSQAIEHLIGLLPEQIEIMGEVVGPGLIELILPREALDEDFASRLLWPRFSWFSLGRKQHVVVRPLERHETPSLHAAWAERWQQLDGRAVGEMVVCVCGRGDQHQVALDASFDSDPGLAALALAGSPQSPPVSGAYEVAVASGVPMMMWKRSSPACERGDSGRCGVPGRQACPGNEFFAELCAVLADTKRDELPETIRRLRSDAQVPPTQEGHLGHHIVLLWDDPRRQIPRGPLAPAKEGRPR
ncbi:trypsin-like peptidase domain-containing protein [Streptomyces sp. NPDC094034]|uniref:VMAP-C domain-containing protein n=1 Tax=Streptomyces sp. NPDC094034 TaxID=3155309 RepID=UPI003323B1BE